MHIHIHSYRPVRHLAWEPLQQPLGMQSEVQPRHLEPNAMSFSAAMRACDQGEQRQQAQGMLSEMRNGPLEPNVFMYNSAIGACAKGERDP